MKLWGVEGESLGNPVKDWTWFRGRRMACIEKRYHDRWEWWIKLPGAARLEGTRSYATAGGARLALIRAVKRLGIKVPK